MNIRWLLPTVNATIAPAAPAAKTQYRGPETLTLFRCFLLVCPSDLHHLVLKIRITYAGLRSLIENDFQFQRKSNSTEFRYRVSNEKEKIFGWNYSPVKLRRAFFEEGGDAFLEIG